MRQDAPAPRHIAVPFRLLTGLFILLCLCGTGGAAHADITLDTLVGFGQNAASGARYRPNSWIPVTVYIGGQGMRGMGQLQLLVRQGEHTTNYTKRISLHEGPLNEVANFTVMLQTQNQWGGSTGLSMQAQLLVDGRKVADKHSSLPLGVQEESFNILALAKDGSGMNFLVKKRLGLFHRYYNPSIQTNRNSISPADVNDYDKINSFASSTVMYTLSTALPASAQGYDMVDAVALADMPLDNLTEDQTEALKGYVRNGGTLILSGGSDLSRLKAAFYTDMLPLDRIGMRSTQDLGPLAQRYREPLPLSAPIGLVTGTPKPGTEALLGDLIYSRPYGNGTVLLTAFDYLDPTLRSWKAAPSLWRDLLRCNPNRVSPRRTLAANARFSEGGMQPLADAMAGKQATNAPPMLVVTIFLAAYLILLVPVSYFLLKKLDKRELAWFTSPLLILGFTVISYLIAVSIKGGDLTINRVVVLETTAGSDQVAGYGQMTLYSPRRAGYDISMAPTSDANSPYRTLVPAEVLTGGSGTLSGDLTVDMDTTAMLRGTEVRLWDKRSFDTPVAVNLGGTVEATTRMLDHQNVQVTIVNKTRYTLQDCVVVTGGQAAVVGSLAPGASTQQTVKWSYKDFGGGLVLPSNEQNFPGSAGTQDTTKETPERTQARLRSGLTSALSPQNNGGYNYYGESPQSYGRNANALLGWFSDPLLKVQVDGKQAAGLEANLLMVHLPTPGNADPEIRQAMNPFLQEPIYTLQEDVPGAPRANINRNGIYR